MEFTEAVRLRRMIRRFRPDPIPPDELRRLVELGLRAPSAGFSQGWDFLVLSGPDQVNTFWSATSGDAEPDDNWLAGLKTAPALVVCCSDKQTYLDRYAEPDKPWPDRDESHWPIPYWDVDTGMAAMIILLAAVDAGLGGLFFGVPGEAMAAVHTALDIPTDRRIVGVIALGHPERTAPSGSTRSRRRRPAADVVHFGRFGRPFDDTGFDGTGFDGTGFDDAAFDSPDSSASAPAVSTSTDASNDQNRG